MGNSRAICSLALAYLVALASLGRPLNATESMALITFRWMISFLSMVMCPTPGTFCTLTFSSEPRSWLVFATGSPLPLAI
jgi:hypothetical protein